MQQQNDKNVFYVFFRLLFAANAERKQWKNIQLERGQLVCSLGTLATELGFSKQSLRTILKKLESSSDIEIKSTNKYSIITICEYDNLVVCEGGTNKLINTQSNKQTNTLTNKQSNKQKSSQLTESQYTYEQPTEKTNTLTNTLTNTQSNKQTNTLTNKQNDDDIISELRERIAQLEKEKEELIRASKKKPKPFAPPTIDDVSAYITEQGFHFDAVTFVSYYESNGWLVGKNKMKDWKAACRTWERKRNSYNQPRKSEEVGTVLRGNNTGKYDNMDLW